LCAAVIADECKNWRRFTARLLQMQLSRDRMQGEEVGEEGRQLIGKLARDECVSHDHATVAVDGNVAIGLDELPVA
jgi:hypothetical protein